MKILNKPIREKFKFNYFLTKVQYPAHLLFLTLEFNVPPGKGNRFRCKLH
ncbi:hypothetical protein ACRRTK_010411 [Alexandromys fortis]